MAPAPAPSFLCAILHQDEMTGSFNGLTPEFEKMLGGHRANLPVVSVLFAGKSRQGKSWTIEQLTALLLHANYDPSAGSVCGVCFTRIPVAADARGPLADAPTSADHGSCTVGMDALGFDFKLTREVTGTDSDGARTTHHVVEHGVLLLIDTEGGNAADRRDGARVAVATMLCCLRGAGRLAYVATDGIWSSDPGDDLGKRLGTAEPYLRVTGVSPEDLRLLLVFNRQGDDVPSLDAPTADALCGRFRTSLGAPPGQPAEPFPVVAMGYVPAGLQGVAMGRVTLDAAGLPRQAKLKEEFGC